MVSGGISLISLQAFVRLILYSHFENMYNPKKQSYHHHKDGQFVTSEYLFHQANEVVLLISSHLLINGFYD